MQQMRINVQFVWILMGFSLGSIVNALLPSPFTCKPSSVERGFMASPVALRTRLERLPSAATKISRVVVLKLRKISRRSQMTEQV